MISALLVHYCGGQCEVAFLHRPLGHLTTQRPSFILPESPCYPLYQQVGTYTLAVKGLMSRQR